MPTDLIADLILLAAILALGALVARITLGRSTSLRIASLAFPVGSGLLTWTLFLASWIGWRTDLRTATVLLGGGCAACLAVWGLGRIRTPASSGVQDSALRTADRSDRRLGLLLAAIVAILVAANVFISIARSYSVWDSIAIWSVKGYGIALEGSVFAGREWGAHSLAYPLNIPLQIALFSLAGGDPLPGSKVVFSLFFLSLLLGVYAFFRSHGLRRTVAGLGVLCLATVPVLFTESTTGYANAPMVTYLVLGGLAILEGGLRSSTRELITGSLLLGLASWTRVEGALYVGVILVSAFIVLAASHGARAAWGWALVPLAVLVIPWIVFYRLYGAESSQAVDAFSAAAKAILAGQFHLGALRLVLQQTGRAFLDLGAWGWAWILAGALSVVGYRGAPRLDRKGFLAVAAMGLATLLATILFFYLGSFGTPDLRGWLERSYDRALLVSPVLLLVGSLLLLRGPQRADEGAAAAGTEHQGSMRLSSE